MAKKEMERDFKLEYSTYYRLMNKEKRSVWGTPTGDKCHFHTPDEIKMLYEIEKKYHEWRVEKHFYHTPIRI